MRKHLCSSIQWILALILFGFIVKYTGIMQAQEVGTQTLERKALSASELILKMNESSRWDQVESTYAAVEVSLIDAAGNVGTLRLIQYGKRVDDKQSDGKQGDTIQGADAFMSLVQFVAPASLKNTRFLSRDGSQWVYLPALKKVRRVASADKNSSFMGTDFSYGDMSFDYTPEGYGYDILREELLFGDDCYVLESRVIAPKDEQYDRTFTWVSKTSFLPRKTEFYKDGAHIKTLTIEDIKTVQGHLTPIKTRMKTEATGHQTILSIKGFVYNKELPAALFSKKYLQTGAL